MAVAEKFVPQNKYAPSNRVGSRRILSAYVEDAYGTLRQSELLNTMRVKIDAINADYSTTQNLMEEHEFTRRYVSYFSKFENKIIDQAKLYNYQPSYYQDALRRALTKIASFSEIKLSVSLTEDFSLFFTLNKEGKLIYYEYYPKADKEEGEAEVLISIFEGGKKVKHFECDLEDSNSRLDPFL